jgi:hypothetical protein
MDSQAAVREVPVVIYFATCMDICEVRIFPSLNIRCKGHLSNIYATENETGLMFSSRYGILPQPEKEIVLTSLNNIASKLGKVKAIPVTGRRGP